MHCQVHKKNKMSVHDRGVVASLGVNIDSVETELHVRSWHGQTFRIKSVCKLKNKLLFWGASTDKLLLAASNDTVPKLIVFDLAGHPRKERPTLWHRLKEVVHVPNHPQTLQICSLRPCSQCTTRAHFCLGG
jgi:hypothetical protein